jgi:hypothetical protein
MRCDILWPTLHLICVVVDFKKVGEVKHLRETLIEDVIAYHESVENVGPSMSVLGSSTRWVILMLTPTRTRP